MPLKSKSSQNSAFLRDLLERVIAMIPADEPDKGRAKIRADALRAFHLTHEDWRSGDADVWCHEMEPILVKAIDAMNNDSPNALKHWMTVNKIPSRSGRPWTAKAITALKTRLAELSPVGNEQRGLRPGIDIPLPTSTPWPPPSPDTLEKRRTTRRNRQDSREEFKRIRIEQRQRRAGDFSLLGDE
jgi:hypothetical protein